MASSSVSYCARGCSPGIGDFRARIGEKDIHPLDCGTAIADIGFKDVWASRECNGGGRASAGCNGDWGAIHIDLTVANLVEPSPSEDCCASWRIGWDVEGKICDGCRAATDVGVNDFEFVDGCSVFAWIAERYLTASASMGSTSHDRGGLGASCWPSGNRRPSSSGVCKIREISSAWVWESWRRERASHGIVHGSGFDVGRVVL